MRTVAAALAGIAGVVLLLASAAMWTTHDLSVDPFASAEIGEASTGVSRDASSITGLTHATGAGLNRQRLFAAASAGDADIGVSSNANGGRPVARVTSAVAEMSIYSPTATATPTASSTPTTTATPTATTPPTATPTPRPPFVWPAGAFISQRMGANHPYGIDIGAKYQPVYAVRDGRVIFVGGDPCCSYGNYVVVEHDQGWTSLYAHLDAFAVSVGGHVAQGQRIGTSGHTGKSSGPHLHFELRSWGTPVDPVAYLSAR